MSRIVVVGTVALAALVGACGDDDAASVDAAPLITEELVCDDGLDQDADGAIDCADTDCADDIAAAGACVNAADLAIYRDLDGNIEWNKCVPPAPNGRGCFTNVACNTTCVEENTSLSNACSGCFAELIACFIGKCATPCNGGGGSPACTECVAQNCGAAYGDCFGSLVCEYEYGCRDTADNDGDGLIDGADPDCQ